MSESNQTLIQQFYVSFQASRSDLTSRLASLKSEGSASVEVLNELALEIARLRKALTDATVYLPSYDQRQYEAHLKAIEQSLAELRASSSSKPKFSFRRKQPVQSSSTPASLPQASNPVADLKHVAVSSQSSGRILCNRTNEYLTVSSLPPSNTSSDLTISNLDHCIVNLLWRPTSNVEQQTKITALHVRDVSNSILILPPLIDGSAMFHNLSRCIVVLGCHQFRMHTSQHVHVYLAISSSPIIEHCSDISFAGYPLALCGSDKARQKVVTSNKYQSVQDFSHIRPTPSPNWRILPGDSEMADTDWPVSLDVIPQVELARLLPQ